MNQLIRIATIEPSSQSNTGLVGYLDAAEKFVKDVKLHSEQDVTGERQVDGRFFVFCPSDQEFRRAENSARMLENFVRPHIVRFMDGQRHVAMQSSQTPRHR